MRNEKKLDRQDRINWIDYAKGIGVFAVVIGHMAMSPTLLLWIFSFHMPLFFIISGILMYEKNKYSNFSKPIWLVIKKRASSLLYPYFVFSIFSIVATVIYKFFQSEVDIFHGIISTFAFDGIRALWFLPALFLAEIFFIALKKMMKKDIYIILTYAVVVIITSLFCYYYDYTSDWFVQKYILRLVNILNRALIGSVFICIGYYSMKIKLHFKGNKILYFFLIITFFIISISLLLFNNGVDLRLSVIGNPIVFYISAIFGAYFVITFCKLIDVFHIKLHIIPFWGKNSLIIFATHYNLFITNFAGYLVLFNVFRNIQAIIIVMMIESLLVLIINKWFSFIYNYKSFKKIIEREM